MQDHLKALENFNQAIKLEPNNSECYFFKGIVLEELLEYEAALDCYNRAIDLNPNLFEVYANKASIFDDLQDYVNALECYEKAIKLSIKKRPDLFYNKGLIYYKMKAEENLDETNKN